jgi:F-type H+-transporting ATPase subunit gamma
MNEFRSYAHTYDGVIKNISDNTVLSSHSFFGKILNKIEGGNGNIGIIIISTDRGLCGSFNMNLFKLFYEELKIKGLNSSRVKLYILGKKAFDFFKKTNYDVIFSKFFSEADSLINLSGLLADDISKDFIENKIMEIYIISNIYISTLHQKAQIILIS